MSDARWAEVEADVATAHETRRFRQIAMRGYGTFEPTRAAPSVAAAGVLAIGLTDAISAFRRGIDPDG